MAITFRPVVKFLHLPVAERYDKAANAAALAMGQQMVDELPMYTPNRTGATIDSMEDKYIPARSSGTPFLTLTWSTSYAGVIYKGTSRSGRHMEFNRDKSPLATAKWFDVAKKYRGKAWFNTYEAAYRKAAK